MAIGMAFGSLLNRSKLVFYTDVIASGLAALALTSAVVISRRALTGGFAAACWTIFAALLAGRIAYGPWACRPQPRRLGDHPSG